VLEQIGLETETGNTGVRDMAVATVPTLLGTIVQGEYLKKAAKINAGVCGNGGCGGSGTSIVNQVVSESVANSATNAITEVMVGCPTGDCAGAGR